VSCPACFALLFDGAAFCPHCGAARARAELAGVEPTRCPACRGGMQWIRVGQADLLECERCDGTWIEAEGFERLCADRESRAAVLHAPPGQAPAPDRRAEPVRYRPCPRCGKLMNRLNFGRQSGTILDVCRGHGTFLDRGELHQVIRFIHEGGLDRAREADIERLRAEERRLRDRGREEVRLTTTGSGGAWNPRWLGELIAALFEPR
jgi:Zn-finger nucleic acid-binding protein